MKITSFLIVAEEARIVSHLRQLRARHSSVFRQFSVFFPLNWAAFDRHPLEMTFAVIKTVLLLLWLEEKMFHSLNAFVMSSLSTND